MTSSHFAQNSIILIHIDLQLVLLFNLVIIILFRYFRDFTSTFYGKSNKGERRKFQDKCLMGIFYRPPTKLRESNVLHLFVCSQVL